MSFDPVAGAGSPEQALKAWREGAAMAGSANTHPGVYLGATAVPSIGFPGPLPCPPPTHPVHYRPARAVNQYCMPGTRMAPGWAVPEPALCGLAAVTQGVGFARTTVGRAAMERHGWLPGLLAPGLLPGAYVPEMAVPGTAAWGVGQFGDLGGGSGHPVPPMEFGLPQMRQYGQPYVPLGVVSPQDAFGPAVPEHVVRGQVYVPQQASVGLPIAADASQAGASLVEPSFPSLPCFTPQQLDPRANSAPGHVCDALREGQLVGNGQWDWDWRTKVDGAEQGAGSRQEKNCEAISANRRASKDKVSDQCTTVGEEVAGSAPCPAPVGQGPSTASEPKAAHSEADGEEQRRGSVAASGSDHHQPASQSSRKLVDHSSGSHARSAEVLQRSIQGMALGQEPAPTFHPLPPMFMDPPQRLSSLRSAGSKSIPTMAVLQTCRQENQLVSEHADSHQEMSLMLAIPGLTIGKAPMLTLQQAGSMLRAISEPLACLKVGRLTRKLGPNPGLLRATEDVGMLTLWLSPSSDVSVIWHAIKNPEDEDWDSAAIAEDGDGGNSSEDPVIEFAEGFHEEFSMAEVSEELAWVAADSTCLSEGCGIKLEMVEQDPSGRSFRLVRRSNHVRQKQELATRLDAEKAKAGGHVSTEVAKLYDLLNACSSEPDTEDNFHFWIAEKSLPKGLEVLKNMSDQLKTLPTLSEKSGVPQWKLQEVCQWFREAAETSQQIQDSDRPANGAPAQVPEQTAQTNPPQAYLPLPSHLMSTLNPTYFMDALLHENPSLPAEAEAGRGDQEEGEQGSRHVSESCASSATANFIVSDKQLGMTLLSTASVTVAVGVEGTTEILSIEEAHKAASDSAHQLAKKRAERGARVEAERLGRRRLEELAAERAAKWTALSKALRESDPAQQNTSAMDSTQAQPPGPVAGPSSRLLNKANTRGEALQPVSECGRSAGPGSSTGSISVEDTRHRDSLQVQTQWRPRMSGSTRGWGGKDLSDVGTVSFAGSSPLDKPESLLSHDQAFGTHGKVANWSSAANMGPLPCMGFPSLIPAHRGMSFSALHSGYPGQMGLPCVPAGPHTFGLPNAHPPPENQWRWLQGPWGPTVAHPLECHTSYQPPFGASAQHLAHHPHSSQWLTPIHPGQMPFHHYGRAQGNQGVRTQDGVPVLSASEGRHVWGAGQGQWPHMPHWTLADHQGGPSLRTGWGGVDVDATDTLSSLLGKGTSGEGQGSAEGMRRKSGEI